MFLYTKIDRKHSLPTAKISTSDVTRLINSDEIQSVVRPAGQPIAKRAFPSFHFLTYGIYTDNDHRTIHPKEEPAQEQGRSLPSQPIRQDSPSSRTPQNRAKSQRFSQEVCSRSCWKRVLGNPSLCLGFDCGLVGFCSTMQQLRYLALQ